MGSQKKSRMTKDTIPEDFTLGLVLVDALPVLFYCGSMLLLGRYLHSSFFAAGALLCLIGGAGKVLWKLIVVLRKKNIWPLFIQMRILMPAGFLLVLEALVLQRNRIRIAGISQAVLQFPSVLFFAVGFLGMILMGVFAVVLDSSDVKANWIEQLTNGIAQASFFIGLLLL